MQHQSRPLHRVVSACSDGVQKPELTNLTSERIKDQV